MSAEALLPLCSWFVFLGEVGVAYTSNLVMTVIMLAVPFLAGMCIKSTHSFYGDLKMGVTALLSDFTQPWALTD